MPVEAQKFKELARAWLVGITGMSALVSTRIYYGAPMGPPTYPLITFGMSRRPRTDYPLTAWTVTLRVSIYGITAATVDPIEDLILDDLSRTDVPGSKLTDANVLCPYLALTDVSEDDAMFNPEDGRYESLARTLTFEAVIVSKET